MKSESKMTHLTPKQLARRAEEQIIQQAILGASLAEIAAYHEVTEDWLIKTFARQIAKAYAKRNIHIRSALTRLAFQGNIQALKRITDLEKKANDAASRSL
jgi:hypothetical protein